MSKLKTIILLLNFLFFISLSKAEIIDEIIIEGNKRILMKL